MILAPLAGKLFNRTLESERAWFHMADLHLRACEILLDACWQAKQRFDRLVKQGQTEFDSPSDIELVQNTWLHPEISLLAGLAVENLLKGLWVLKNPGGLSSTDKLPKRLQTHDVLKLATDLAIGANEAETECLKHLSQMAKWQGKYLIPLHRGDNEQINREWVNPCWLLSKYDVASNQPAFPDEFLSLIKKIDAEVANAKVEKARSEGN